MVGNPSGTADSDEFPTKLAVGSSSSEITTWSEIRRKFQTDFHPQLIIVIAVGISNHCIRRKFIVFCSNEFPTDVGSDRFITAFFRHKRRWNFRPLSPLEIYWQYFLRVSDELGSHRFWRGHFPTVSYEFQTTINFIVQINIQYCFYLCWIFLLNTFFKMFKIKS